MKRDLWTKQAVFDIIRNIQDPEHPLTLEQLKVVNVDHIEVVDVHQQGQMNNKMKDDDSDLSYSTVDVRLT